MIFLSLTGRGQGEGFCAVTLSPPGRGKWVMGLLPFPSPLAGEGEGYA